MKNNKLLFVYLIILYKEIQNDLKTSLDIVPFFKII